MARISNEFKTGIMLLVCIFIALYFIYATGALRIDREGYEMIVEYGFISGLRENSPVKLCGADVGHVKDITLSYEDIAKVAVTLWLDDEARIREDAKFYITQTGLMGEKYVEVKAGSEGTPYLKPNAKVKGEDPFRLEDLMEKADEVVKNVNEALVGFKTLSDHADDVITRDEVDNTLKNIEATTANLREFSEDLKRHPWKLVIKTDPPEEENNNDMDSMSGSEDTERGVSCESGVLR